MRQRINNAEGAKISEDKIRYTEMHIECDTAGKLISIISEVF